jgi:dTDP-glucose 4,6-dehydratase
MVLGERMSKNVLLTGGAGFIGHHIVDYIISNTDWNITTLDRLDYSGNLNRLHEILDGYSASDKKRVNVVFHDLKAEINPHVAHRIGAVDTILHIAAGSHVDRSIMYPMEFVQDNIIGTVNLLEYARRLNDLETFLYFSTDEVFGPAPSGIRYEERDRYNSSNPYAATKAAAEEMCVAYENTYKMPIMITHTMNVFGERQTPEKFIPMCIRSVNQDKSVTIHADKTKTKAGSRFYIHARDVADAIHFLVTKKPDCPEDFGNAHCPKFNIVGAEEIDNLSLAKMIADAQNKELKYEMVDFHSSRPGHDLRYALSGDLMKSLGWTPKISLTNRVKEVSDWYLQNNQWLGV